MVESFLERRHGLRVRVDGGIRSDRAFAVSVRVLDIGATGVLLASSQSFEVGQHARMSARLGDRQIEAEVVVRRVDAAGGDKGGYKIGARFVSLDEATRHTLQQFLAGDGNT